MPFTAKAEKRTETGKNPVRRLRRAGQVPAVIYGHGDPSIMLTINEHEFSRMLEKLRGHSPVIELELDGTTTSCIIKTLQRNPTNGHLLHVDFQKVHAEEKVTVNVPVILHGTAIGVKEGGMLDHLMREVSVRATIDKVPEHFDVEITLLKMGESFHLSELKTDDIEFTVPLDSPVVTVLEPRKLAAEGPKPAADAAAPKAEGEAEEPAGEEAESAEDKKKKKK